MQTPTILIFGLVFAPCGWILDLTSTVAPNWRTITNIGKQPPDLVLQQGIWHICKSFTTSRRIDCTIEDREYFSNQVVITAQRMMVISLIVNILGLVVVAAGVRCWAENPPGWTVTGVGGLLVFFSGLLTIIPIAWFNQSLNSIKAPSVDIRVGYSIILGYIGGLMKISGGLALFVGIRRCCEGLNRGESPERELEPVRYPPGHRQTDGIENTAYNRRPSDSDF